MAPSTVPEEQGNRSVEPPQESPDQGPGEPPEDAIPDKPTVAPPEGIGRICDGEGNFREEVISGSYTAMGTNPEGSDPTSYSGIVTLGLAEDGIFRQAWLIGKSDYRGTGVLVGDVLAVDWGAKFPVNYQVQCNGTLVGTWANGLASETLTPSGCEGEAIQPGDLAGSYTVRGTNPSSIGTLDDPYEGVATVMEETPNFYRISWRVGAGATATMSSGTFALEGKTVSVDWGDIERYPTVYDRHCGRGILLGIWADGKGTETLLPIECGREVGRDLSGSYDVFVVGTDGIVQAGTEVLEAGVGDEYTLVRTIDTRNVTGQGSLEGSTMVVGWSEGPAATFAVDWCGGFLLGVWDDGEGFNVTKEHLVRRA
eukprot:evm.model.scf_4.4 EVM.evm.TU.scf_4.4   scf_4:139164-140534(+)